MLLFRKLIVSLFSLWTGISAAQQVIRGKVVESDSSTAMPFVYIISKSSGNGTMSDSEGRFSLHTISGDTILCSYVGHLKLKIPVSSLRPDAQGSVLLVMTPLPVSLNPVTVTTFRFKDYEREYMNDIIDRSRIRKMDYAFSPITSLYMRYSKEGRQVNKLARIFEGLLLEEQVQKKLSRDILVKLTGDENIDYMAFRKYCYYVNDYYISTHDGAELYSKVMDCYKQYRRDMRK